MTEKDGFSVRGRVKHHPAILNRRSSCESCCDFGEAMHLINKQDRFLRRWRVRRASSTTRRTSLTPKKLCRTLDETPPGRTRNQISEGRLTRWQAPQHHGRNGDAITRTRRQEAAQRLPSPSR